MEIGLLDKKYKVLIVRKQNKNTYLRVKPDFTVLVTTGPFTTEKEVLKLLEKNKDFLIRTIKKRERQSLINDNFYYLGNKYDIIIFKQSNNVEIDGNKIYVSSMKELDKWYQSEMKEIFNKQLIYNYERFTENIKLPKLRIRKMKTRWGVCNITNEIITLNSELLKYDLSVINYVIIHELAHLIYPNHSAMFWDVVSKYCPNYKKIRKFMRE
ncbi:MAG: SprT family zinc-dependent metalloprotease [Bacilli bacterium]|nr:SprT family zinc-dependent metalloprotease [Bacilli bacterium]